MTRVFAKRTFQRKNFSPLKAQLLVFYHLRIHVLRVVRPSNRFVICGCCPINAVLILQDQGILEESFGT